jgi:LAO/AO transport system kinase
VDLATVTAGDARAIARAITLVESGSVDAAAVVAAARASGRTAFRIGLTGPPGAGKSRLADRLVREYRAGGSKVAVLAVDPSSPFSGGAVLGDRVRMQTHAGDPGVFVRSMATRGRLGGLAAATAGAADILSAAGFDPVLIETVGVGQAEVDIARAASVVVVVFAPGAGDEMQTMKAGIMEIADVFVVNKADREGADRTVSAIRAALSLRPARTGDWQPPVLRTVATTGEGVPELVAAIASCRSFKGPASPAAPAPDAAVPLDHVAVAVADASALAAMFKDLFGLETDAPEDVGQHRLRFVQTAGPTIELVEPLGPGAPVARFLASHGTGLHHICLRVADIDSSLAALKSRGVRLIDEHPRTGAHGSRIAFLHPSSTGGVLVELKQEHIPS